MPFRAYYVNGLPSGTDALGAPLQHAIYASDYNAATSAWSTRRAITIEGVVDGNAVDPDILRLDDGRYLLTYMRGRFVPENPEPVTTIYTAWSADGIRFYDPVALYRPATPTGGGAPVALTDPSLLRLTDGRWLLAISSPDSSSAQFFTSTDGRSFSASGLTLPAFSPDLQLLPDGRVRLFYADGPAGGIASRLSADGGQSWSVESGLRKAGPGFDPSVFALADGGWGMLFKTQGPVSPGGSQLAAHRTSLATSTDGSSFTTTQTEFASGASVAEGVDFNGLTVSLSFLGAAATPDRIEVGGAGAHVRAGAGIDTAVFPVARAALQLQRDSWLAGDWIGKLAANPSVTYFLRGVERFAFTDLAVAMDLEGNAGAAAKILGAAFGPAAVREKAYVGIALHFLDVLGATPEALMQIALGARLGPAPSHAQVVDLLYTNVIGTPPTAEVRAALTAVLDNGSYTMSGLAMAVAETEFNRAAIDLVGLAQRGLEYQPWVG
jgi:hypothetical protein